MGCPEKPSAPGSGGALTASFAIYFLPVPSFGGLTCWAITLAGSVEQALRGVTPWSYPWIELACAAVAQAIVFAVLSRAHPRGPAATAVARAACVVFGYAAFVAIAAEQRPQRLWEAISGPRDNRSFKLVRTVPGFTLGRCWPRDVPRAGRQRLLAVDRERRLSFLHAGTLEFEGIPGHPCLDNRDLQIGDSGAILAGEWLFKSPGAKPEKTYEMAVGKMYPRLSDDGRWIAWQEDEPARVVLRPVDGAGSRTVPVSRMYGRIHSVDMDGGRLVFAMGGNRVAVTDLDGRLRADAPEAGRFGWDRQYTVPAGWAVWDDVATGGCEVVWRLNGVLGRHRTAPRRDLVALSIDPSGRYIALRTCPSTVYSGRGAVYVLYAATGQEAFRANLDVYRGVVEFLGTRHLVFDAFDDGTAAILIHELP